MVEFEEAWYETWEQTTVHDLVNGSERAHLHGLSQPNTISFAEAHRVAHTSDISKLCTTSPSGSGAIYSRHNYYMIFF